MIWQSAAPTRGPSVAYAIGEMLEAFLCSVDSESFSRILEEVRVVNDVAAAGAGGDLQSSPPAPSRRPTPQAPTVAAEMHQSRQRKPSMAQVAQEKHRSKVRSVDDLSRLLQKGGVSSTIHTSASTTSLMQMAPPAVAAPTPSMVGFAVDVSGEDIAGESEKLQYETYNEHGEKVIQEFRPFVQRVVYTSQRNNANFGIFPELKDACTPVSVPPTPYGQTQFNAQWNHYTSSVLEFVQERLDIVQRTNRDNFNILDRHSLRSAQHSNDEHEEEDLTEQEKRRAIVDSTNKMLVIDLKADNHPRYTLGKDFLDPTHTNLGYKVETSMRSKLHLVASYVRASEHLIHTILKEAEADMLDWEFVSNTRDVYVMRRLRPIKKRNLLQSSNATATATAATAAATNPSPPFETSQHCFMGRGLVDASAEFIFDLVRRPDKRHFFDSMLNEELVLENLAVGEDAAQFENSSVGNLLVYYHLFETNRCFLRYARDFCVVQYAKKVVQRGQPTKYVVVGASINHANCPLRDDVERATLDLFGWVVEQTPRANQSKVSYMMHIDFGKSGVPTHLLNTFSFRQPLAVHYLRRHIKSMREQQQREDGESGGSAQE